jgi:hypothetical protein
MADSVSMLKEYNMRQSYKTEHSDVKQKYSGEFRKQKVASDLIK